MEKIKTIIFYFLSILSLFSVSFLWNNPLTLSLTLLMIGILMIIILKKIHYIIIFLFCGIIGAIAEIIGIYFGAWTYSKPSIYGIPIWLPFLWGIAALFLIKLSESIKKITSNIKTNK